MLLFVLFNLALIGTCHPFVLQVTNQNCVRRNFKDSLASWTKRLNLASGNVTEGSRSLVNVQYRSGMTQPVSGFLANAFGREAVLIHLYSLYGMNQLLPFRVSNFGGLLHFYGGDPALIHTLNPLTGKYKAVNLGGRSRRFFVAIEAGDKKFLLLGISVVNVSPLPSTFEFAKKGNLLKKFPQHSKIIDELFERSPDFP